MDDNRRLDEEEIAIEERRVVRGSEPISEGILRPVEHGIEPRTQWLIDTDAIRRKSIVGSEIEAHEALVARRSDKGRNVDLERPQKSSKWSRRKERYPIRLVEEDKEGKEAIVDDKSHEGAAEEPREPADDKGLHLTEATRFLRRDLLDRS
jgi:hypothetical protein